MTSNKSALILFYEGVSSDNKGRSLDEILQWPYESLESVHDYIQWLFPLNSSSEFNLNAPILTNKDMAAFHSSSQLNENLLRSLKVLLDFYGFSLEYNKVVRAPNFNARAANWLNYGNHNMLRITRILKSLNLLGLGGYAHQFFLALQGVYKDHQLAIGDSFYYWEAALNES